MKVWRGAVSEGQSEGPKEKTGARAWNDNRLLVDKLLSLDRDPFTHSLPLLITR